MQEDKPKIETGGPVPQNPNKAPENQAQTARENRAAQFESQGLNSYDVPPDNETARTDDTDTTTLPNESSCNCAP